MIIADLSWVDKLEALLLTYGEDLTEVEQTDLAVELANRMKRSEDMRYGWNRLQYEIGNVAAKKK